MGRLPARAAERFLGAILPLLAVDKGLLDVAVIALRKALFGKSGGCGCGSGWGGGRGSGCDGRRAACAGLCQVLRAVSAGGCGSGDDGAAGSLSQSLSQSRFGTGGVEAAERGVLLHEVFGLLRRGLGQQGGVRAQVYASLTDAVAAAPALAPQAAALLYQHLCAFCPCLCEDDDDDNDGEECAWPVSVEGAVWEGCGAEPLPLLVAALGRVSKYLAGPGRGEGRNAAAGEDDEFGAEERAGRAVRAAVGHLAERVAAFDPVCAAGFVDRDAEWKRGACRLYRGVCGALIECLVCSCDEGGLTPGAGVVEAIAGLDMRAAALGDYVAAMDASADGVKKKATKTGKKTGKKKGRRSSKKGDNYGDDEEDDGSDEDNNDDEEEENSSDGEDAATAASAEPPKKKAARRVRGSLLSSSSSSSSDVWGEGGDEAAWQWAGEELLSLESVRKLAAGLECGEEDGACVWDEGVRRLVVGSALGHLRRIAGAEGADAGAGAGGICGGSGDSGRAAAAASEFCLYVGSRLFGRYLAPLLDEQPSTVRGNEDDGNNNNEAEAAEGCEAVRLCVVYFARHGTSVELRELLRACIGPADSDAEEHAGMDIEEGDDDEEEDGYGGRGRNEAGARTRAGGEEAGRAMDFYARSFEVRHIIIHSFRFISFRSLSDHPAGADLAGAF